MEIEKNKSQKKWSFENLVRKKKNDQNILDCPPSPEWFQDEVIKKPSPKKPIKNEKLSVLFEDDIEEFKDDEPMIKGKKEIKRKKPQKSKDEKTQTKKPRRKSNLIFDEDFDEIKEKSPEKIKSGWSDLEFDTENENQERFYRCFDYTLYSTNLKPTKIGVDIGSHFCALVGIKIVNGNRIITHAVSLHPGFSDENVKNKKSENPKITGVDFWKSIEHLVYSNDDFSWLFEANSYRIEQQKENNLSLAYAFFAMFSGICYNRDITRDVAFVHGNWKYKIAKNDCSKKCEEGDCLQSIEKNKKTSVIKTMKCYAKKTNQMNFLKFYKVQSKYSKKPDDIPDAFYIASHNK